MPSGWHRLAALGPAPRLQLPLVRAHGPLGELPHGNAAVPRWQALPAISAWPSTRSAACPLVREATFGQLRPRLLPVSASHSRPPGLMATPAGKHTPSADVAAP